MLLRILTPALALALVACGASHTPPEAPAADDHLPVADAPLAEGETGDLEAATAEDRLRAIAEGEHRSAENRARNIHRNPVETLTFFGVSESDTVLELFPGGGWYTEVLAPFLHGTGALHVGNYDPDGPEDQYITRIANMVVDKLASDERLYGEVVHQIFIPGTQVTIEEDGVFDVVLSFRNAHGWARRGVMEETLAEIHRVLRRGGTFGLVTHRAAEGTNWEETVATGYLPEAWVIEQVEAAGFVLDARSDINANERDTRDHPEGVWTLPPTFRLEDENREHWASIGESDRMTLRFVKP